MRLSLNSLPEEGSYSLSKHCGKTSVLCLLVVILQGSEKVLPVWRCFNVSLGLLNILNTVHLQILRISLKSFMYEKWHSLFCQWAGPFAKTFASLHFSK